MSPARGLGGAARRARSRWSTIASERASDRREQVGTGERSEKIRTYNFPQNRITDHRAGVTLHKLEGVLEGDLDELLERVRSEMLTRREQEA